MSATLLKRTGLSAGLTGILLLLGLMAGDLFAGGSARQENGVAQEKKEEKKDDKKDEKKGLSLKPDRKIEFTTDEGTWISLDVSPDGKTIVFELLGDIYTLPIEGGEAKLVDGGMAFDSQPKFSPDGKWIAFLSDRDGNENVWIMHPDGSDRNKFPRTPAANSLHLLGRPMGITSSFPRLLLGSLPLKFGCTTCKAAPACRSPRPSRRRTRRATNATTRWAS